MGVWVLVVVFGGMVVAGLLVGERMLEISHEMDFSPRRMYELDRDHGWGKEITRLQLGRGGRGGGGGKS